MMSASGGTLAGLLGALLGRPGGLLGRLEAIAGPSWAVSGLSWTARGPSGDPPPPVSELIWLRDNSAGKNESARGFCFWAQRTNTKGPEDIPLRA